MSDYVQTRLKHVVTDWAFVVRVLCDEKDVLQVRHDIRHSESNNYE